MKKIILLLFITLFLTGCKDYVEINDLAIVTGIGIDYKDNLFDITTQLIINEKESKTTTYSSKASSIDEALSKISKLSNKELFISHLKVLLITENILTNNINYEDYFLRNSKSKMNYYVFLVNNKDLKNILNDTKNNGSSIYIDKMIKYNNENFSSSIKLKFIDLIYEQYEKDLIPAYPTLTYNDNIKLGNIVIIDKTKKINFNEIESIFYNIVKNNTNKTSLNIDCDNNEFTIEIQNIKTKYQFKNNELILNIKLDSKLSNYNCKYNISDYKTNNKIIKLINNYIEKQTNKIIEISKNNNIDYLGFGNYIYKHNKNYYDKNYNLKDLKIKINIKTNLNSTGELRK